MTALEARQVDALHPSTGRLVLAGALLVISAVLQHLAAVQRWAAPASSHGDRSIEDHLFDYSWPADPWEEVGTSAQLFGVAYLFLALAVLVAFARGRGRDRTTSVTAGAVAVAFGLIGLHALVSGILGSPTPLQETVPALVLGLTAPAGLMVLAARLLRASPLAASACGSLLGATGPGYLVAALAIAPALGGYQSYDTTPWTESVVAAAVAAAGALLLVNAAVRPPLARSGQAA